MYVNFNKLYQFTRRRTCNLKNNVTANFNSFKSRAASKCTVRCICNLNDSPVACNSFKSILTIDMILTVCRLKNCVQLSQVATRIFNVRLLHAFAFSTLLRWFEQTKVTSLRKQQHSVNAR